MGYPVLKFSKSKVNKAGKTLVNHLSENSTQPDNRELLRAFLVLNNWRSCHGYPINTFQATLRTKLKTIDTNALVAQRLKRLPSIILKLKRFENMQLARMQDIGGLRAVVSSLKKVLQLEDNYRNSRFKHDLHTSRDYINKPKKSGYRSIHLVYRYENPIVPKYNGLYIELQIRSRLQHAWATAVETMGTYLDHALKSSEGPEKWLDFFSLVGSAFAHMEGTSPVPGYEELPKEETYQKVIKKMEELDVRDKLMAFSVATKHVSTDSKKGSYHLIVLNSIEKKVSIFTYAKDQLEKANKDYVKLERKASEEKPFQAVLVSAGSIKSLRQAYPNYFLDTREFVKQLNRIKRTVNESIKRMW